MKTVVFFLIIGAGLIGSADLGRYDSNNWDKILRIDCGKVKITILDPREELVGLYCRGAGGDGGCSIIMNDIGLSGSAFEDFGVSVIGESEYGELYFKLEAYPYREASIYLPRDILSSKKKARTFDARLYDGHASLSGISYPEGLRCTSKLSSK